MVHKKKQVKITPERKTSKGSNVWNAPRNIVVNVEELIHQAKVISQLVNEEGILFHSDQLWQNQKKRTVLVFVVDKLTKRIVKSTKDLVIKSNCFPVKKMLVPLLVQLVYIWG